ncbi:hypothetical protein B0A55_03792 [Friedmanniomyces simplex]|uniref:25S rRNA adenine-N(1) methyltransferase n=1 Tax=Friedmanniomyces simplex TaxID=329884 RepID=A0A4U0XEY9_9PEZI|nr:hypothetical protein B0A55_03792 [Friedmanniomyces simplex]
MSVEKPGKPDKKSSGTPKTVTKVLKNRAGLSNGRPPTAAKPSASLSHKKTRDQIRSHHQLNKQLATAEAKGDDAEAGELIKRIEDLGGLQSYQLASIQGQAKDRGGDSSSVLMQWLKPLAEQMALREHKIRMLEVGALSMANACSKSGLFDIERIDLPVPDSDKTQFDIISLSLVLNFVPDPEGRGEMLRRTCQFLNKHARRAFGDELQAIFPALFLVLPAPCIVNSRYINEERLTCMMASMGYVMLQRKLTAKLVYYLWQLRDKPRKDKQDFPKKQVNPGASRNNFCVVLNITPPLRDRTQQRPTRPTSLDAPATLADLTNTENRIEALLSLNGPVMVLFRDMTNQITTLRTRVEKAEAETRDLRTHVDLTFESFAAETTKVIKETNAKCQEVIDSNDEKMAAATMRVEGGP